MVKKSERLLQRILHNINLIERFILDGGLYRIISVKEQFLQSLETITEAIKKLSSRIGENYKYIKDTLMEKIYTVKSVINQLASANKIEKAFTLKDILDEL
ncbi:MAG: hypothetical protein QW327_04840 [Candidatus Odinarchaeota archaeon]